jgi:hypothetical protein
MCEVYEDINNDFLFQRINKYLFLFSSMAEMLQYKYVLHSMFITWSFLKLRYPTILFAETGEYPGNWGNPSAFHSTMKISTM